MSTFAETRHESRHAFCKAVYRNSPVVYLRVDVGISDDRSRYELREERDEHQEVYEGLLRLDIAFVNIERIGHRLEGVE